MALRSGDPLFSIIKGECRRGLKILLNGTKTEARSESIAVSRGLKGSQGVSNGLKVRKAEAPSNAASRKGSQSGAEPQPHAIRFVSKTNPEWRKA